MPSCCDYSLALTIHSFIYFAHFIHSLIFFLLCRYAREGREGSARLALAATASQQLWSTRGLATMPISATLRFAPTTHLPATTAVACSL